MKKLIEILEYHIPNYEAMTEEQQDDLLVALEEYAKRTPTYKPLSELHKDREACRKIWEFVVGEEDVSMDVTDKNDLVYLNGSDSYGNFHELNIWYDSEVFYSIDGDDKGVSFVFDFVNLVHSLGYAPNKQS